MLQELSGCSRARQGSETVSSSPVQDLFLNCRVNEINNLAKLLKTKGIKILRFFAHLVDLALTVC